MATIIGVQFQKNGKLYYFDSNGIEAKTGDYIIVDTARGYDLGEVIMGARDIDEESWNTPLKKAIRLATEQDIQHGRENRSKEKEAFTICQKKIAEHKLEMKLVSVEYAFDNSKILFFFTANGRVDFRSLVKDLASIFKMRIELRQIGVRDEAKMLGGLGPCGRPICCGTFLDQFQPVSIKMAKEQNLSAFIFAPRVSTRRQKPASPLASFVHGTAARSFSIWHRNWVATKLPLATTKMTYSIPQ